MAINVELAGAVTALSMLYLASNAEGQDRPTPDQRVRPPIEIGAIASGFVGDNAFGVGLRVAVPTNERFAFEFGIDWRDLGRRQREPDQLPWVYFVGGRQLLASIPNRRSSVFVLYGVTGWADRSMTMSGLSTSFYPPLLPTGGVAWQVQMGQRAALRGDAQLIWLFSDDLPPAIARIVVGVSIPVGRYPK